MTLSRREAYMSLANSHTQDGSGAALGIMRTNGFAISAKTLTEGGDEDEIYSVVAEQLSHINHSCSPNVTWNWDRASFGMELRAVRKIRKDEEMFVHYCVLDAPSAKRQDVLAPYGFRCSCASCSDPIASDRRRREITSGPFAKAAPGSVSLKASLNQLRQIEEEGLEILPHYIHALRCTAKAYEKAGNLEKEREFRKKVYLHTLGLMGRARAMDNHPRVRRIHDPQFGENLNQSCHCVYEVLFFLVLVCMSCIVLLYHGRPYC
ncbi:hypothetical protein OF83DRAFT_660217 [Amylostereum chailletii]|nr:hypothetical protein OF83DRAFT_660217 [Amylostereum chailletii]